MELIVYIEKDLFFFFSFVFFSSDFNSTDVVRGRPVSSERVSEILWRSIGMRANGLPFDNTSSSFDCGDGVDMDEMEIRAEF